MSLRDAFQTLNRFPELSRPVELAPEAAAPHPARPHPLAGDPIEEQTFAPPGGRKDDTGKDPWGLLPFDAVRAVVKVLAFGAGKYAPRNWEKGMDWQRPFDACLRHLTAWWEGEKADPETGFSHLWHAGCCIMFLIAYELRGAGTDDRPTKKVD